jgi:hypothetical protein
MITFEGTSVAIRYITTIQCYSYMPPASNNKLYGIKVYIDGHPTNPALTATFVNEDMRDLMFNRWTEDVSNYGKQQRPNTGPL